MNIQAENMMQLIVGLITFILGLALGIRANLPSEAHRDGSLMAAVRDNLPAFRAILVRSLKILGRVLVVICCMIVLLLALIVILF